MLDRDSLLDKFLWEVGQGTVDRAVFVDALKEGEDSDLQEFLSHAQRAGVGVKGRREAAFVLLSLGHAEGVSVLSEILADPMTAAAIVSALRDDESLRPWFETEEFQERVATLIESGELENPAALISLGVVLGVPNLATRAMGSISSMPVLTRVHTLSALVGGDHDSEVLDHLLDATAELESESQGCRTAFDRRSPHQHGYLSIVVPRRSVIGSGRRRERIEPPVLQDHVEVAGRIVWQVGTHEPLELVPTSAKPCSVARVESLHDSLHGR